MTQQNTLGRPSIGAFMSKYGIVVIFIGMCLILSIVSPAFRSMRNVTNVIRQVSIIGIVSMGVTFCIITTGIDLSSGSMIALISVVVASLSQNSVNPDQPISVVMPIAFGIGIALILGLALGSVNGTLHAYGKIPPFIATLGMMTVARGAAALFTQGRPVGDLKDTFTFIGTGNFLNVPLPILIYIAMGILSHILLSKTKFGRHVFAIGGNEQAARICGINVRKTLVKVYAYAGFLTAVSAILLTARTSAGNPTYGVSYELDAIASTVIGGTSLSGGIGSIPFCVIGALIIGVLNNGMDLLGVNAYWQQIAKGVIIVVAVLIDARKQKRK
ncbi:MULTISPECIES: ABC transporter permease [unclassified Oceanispirochaeta]|uniref:ABC transporter permease n=1 Tax=unclassified Oceanispirochaeta TaxID=2635722 RepID=UPI00149511E6|nr:MULTISPECIES: ABC transporter permease [unclassified Oceanispirochaeta]MBF9016969.1 ABC transporter permease [Oceanispirochaeta sp. M2]